MLIISRKLYFIIFNILLCLLSSCSTKDALYRKLSKEDPSHREYKGHFKVGSPYTVNNVTYKPKATKHHSEIGMASWYGARYGFHGKKTANGDKYNKEMLTAAHRTLPLPSLVKITNLSNKKSLIVMANDRGPFRKDRVIDVSERAATLLGFKNQGVAKVKVEYLHKETQEFLKQIALKPTHGAKAKKKAKHERCSINCHIKLVNMKHKLFKP